MNVLLFGSMPIYPRHRLVTFVHVLGIVVESYIDGCIPASEDPGIVLQHLNFTQRLLHQLGRLVYARKSETIPTQFLQLIRALFDTRQSKIFVPQDGWVSIQHLVPSALRQPLPLCQRQQLLGLLTSAQGSHNERNTPFSVFLNRTFRTTILISLPNHHISNGGSYRRTSVTKSLCGRLSRLYISSSTARPMFGEFIVKSYLWQGGCLSNPSSHHQLRVQISDFGSVLPV